VSTTVRERLQGHVTEEENADAEAEHAIVEPQVARHANRRVCYAGAIEVVGDVKDENEGKQLSGNVAPGVLCR
jgi:hypothetical protein